MSLASILRSRLIPSVMVSSLPRAAVSAVLGAGRSIIVPSSSSSASSHHLLQRPTTISSSSRSVWIEVIRQVPSEDPNRPGKLTFEDPDVADLRMLRATRAEAPLRKKPNFTRHEKAWMKRKRIKMEKRYNRLQEGVEELKAYIKFKQDNRADW